MTPARLVLVRHAKSDYPTGVPDHDRPLSPRGRRDAVAAGQWLAAGWTELLGGQALLLVSSAKRAQQTCALLAGELPPCEVRTEPALYDAAVSTLISVVARHAVAGRATVVIAHNPGLEQLAAFLTVGSSSPARPRLLEKYPTSAIAVLQLMDEHWADGSAELVEFAVPRG